MGQLFLLLIGLLISDNLLIKMGGHGVMKVPDWKIYKVENIPELMKVQEALAKKGLSDPWLRNEVWRYQQSEWAPRSRGGRIPFSEDSNTVSGPSWSPSFWRKDSPSSAPRKMITTTIIES